MSSFFKDCKYCKHLFSCQFIPASCLFVPHQLLMPGNVIYLGGETVHQVAILLECGRSKLPPLSPSEGLSPYVVNNERNKSVDNTQMILYCWQLLTLYNICVLFNVWIFNTVMIWKSLSSKIRYCGIINTLHCLISSIL